VIATPLLALEKAGAQIVGCISQALAIGD